MKYINDLPHFIKELEKENELQRVQVPVSPDLEISEIYFRQARSQGGGKALLFENVSGSSIPVLVNSMGSRRRMEIAFGNRKMDEIASHIASLLALLQMKKPEKIKDYFSMAGKLIQILRLPPRKLRGKGRCQEIILTGEKIDLGILPVLKSWPEDAGKFITLPLVFTRSLKDSSMNVGMYRMQILDKRSTAMHWQIHKDGSNYHHEYIQAKRRMPVSVVIGSDPAVVFSAISPMPPRMNEMMMAGLLRGRGVRMVKCITNDLHVPENSEIVLEGYVDPDDLVPEGPFGDHTGYYTPVEDFPVFHVTAVTMKKNPVYMTTVVGRSPQEDCYIAEAIERIFLPMFRMIAPEVKDQMLPWDGCFHNCAVLSIKKEFPFQSRKLMNHLWGFSQMSFSKSLVVVDESVNLRDGRKLTDHILNTLRLSDDVFSGEGILDQLDHSGFSPLYGGKIGLDLTGRTPEAPALKKKKSPAKARFQPEKILSSLRRKSVDAAACRLYGAKLRNPVLILSVNKKITQGKLGEKISKILKLKGKSVFPFTAVIVLDGCDDIHDDSIVLWKLLGNTDPARDIVKIENASAPDGLIFVIDSSSKNKKDGYERIWPEENRMDEETISLVDSKWKEMFGEEPFTVKRP